MEVHRYELVLNLLVKGSATFDYFGSSSTDVLLWFFLVKMRWYRFGSCGVLKFANVYGISVDYTLNSELVLCVVVH